MKTGKAAGSNVQKQICVIILFQIQDNILFSVKIKRRKILNIFCRSQQRMQDEMNCWKPRRKSVKQFAWYNTVTLNAGLSFTIVPGPIWLGFSLLEFANCHFSCGFAPLWTNMKEERSIFWAGAQEDNFPNKNMCFQTLREEADWFWVMINRRRVTTKSESPTWIHNRPD